MRTLAIASLFGSIVALGACGKGKPKYKAPAATAVEKPQGSAGFVEPKARKQLAIPPLSGKAPKKAAAIDAAAIEAVSKLTFPGFRLDVRGHSANAVEIVQRTEDHPMLTTTIRLGACAQDCVPMDLAKWQDNTKVTKQFLAAPLRKAPDTVFKVGTTTLAGQTMIYTYQLGQALGSDGGAYSDTYVLYYNDGVNQARIVTMYSDDPMRNKEAMAKKAPEQQLAQLAAAFMDAYTQAW